MKHNLSNFPNGIFITDHELKMKEWQVQFMRELEILFLEMIQEVKIARKGNKSLIYKENDCFYRNQLSNLNKLEKEIFGYGKQKR